MDDETYIRMQVSRGPGRMRPFCSRGFCTTAATARAGIWVTHFCLRSHRCPSRARSNRTYALCAADSTRDVFPRRSRCRLIYLYLYIPSIDSVRPQRSAAGGGWDQRQRIPGRRSSPASEKPSEPVNQSKTCRSRIFDSGVAPDPKNSEVHVKPPVFPRCRVLWDSI